MRAWRISLSVAGILLILLGVVSLFTITIGQLAILAVWMIGAVVIHDGIIAPVTVTVGWALAKIVPPRARRYVQAFLITGGLVTIIAIPLILRRNTQPVAKAILQQNYAGNLTLLLAIIAAISLLLYAINIAHDRRPGTGDETPSPVTRH